MGRKRKRREEEILKKIRRLEKEVLNNRHRYSHGSVGSESRSDQENEIPCDTEPENINGFLNDDAYYEAYSPASSPQQPDNTEVPQTPLGKEAKPVDNAQLLPGTSGKNDESDVIIQEVTHLDDEILTILGDPPKDEFPVGPNVHNDIASRLQDVLLNGLKKDQKHKMIEDYPIPGNCPFFGAPVLNAEVKAAISDSMQKKDASLAARQRQVGSALTALVKSMDILVNDKSHSSQQVLKHVSSACRLLCDSHFIDTKLRRSFLISTLNNKLKDTLKESKRDKSLFGEDLAEKLKATKAISKSSQDLSYNKPKSMVTRNPASTSTQSNLNWKRPQPYYQNPSRRLPPSHRTAGAQATSHYRNRAEADSRRRPPPPRARASAHYKKRQ